MMSLIGPNCLWHLALYSKWRIRHKKNSCEYANTLNTLYKNKLPLQPPGLLVPQMHIYYDSLNHLLHYDLAVSWAIHTYSYKIHNTYVHSTHLNNGQCIVSLRILWTCALRKHATCTHTVACTRHMHKVRPTCRCVHVDCTGHLCPA